MRALAGAVPARCTTTPVPAGRSSTYEAGDVVANGPGRRDDGLGAVHGRPAGGRVEGGVATRREHRVRRTLHPLSAAAAGKEQPCLSASQAPLPQRCERPPRARALVCTLLHACACACVTVQHSDIGIVAAHRRASSRADVGNATPGMPRPCTAAWSRQQWSFASGPAPPHGPTGRGSCPSVVTFGPPLVRWPLLLVKRSLRGRREGAAPCWAGRLQHSTTVSTQLTHSLPNLQSRWALCAGPVARRRTHTQQHAVACPFGSTSCATTHQPPPEGVEG